MIDVHVMVAYLWNHVGLRIDPSNTKIYWEHHQAVGSPWISACGDDWDTTMIPLGIYGDDARTRQLPYSTPEKVLGIYLNCPLFRPKSVRQSRWLLFAIEEALLYKRLTLNSIFRRIAWSFNILWNGYLPTRGPSNELLEQAPWVPITNGLNRFFCSEIRGDWSWHRRVFGMISSWKAGVNAPVCWKCPSYATGNCPYYHVDDESMSQTPDHTLVEFLLQEMPDDDICILALQV